MLMKRSDFFQRVTRQFGPDYGPSVLEDHILSSPIGMSANQALEQGVDPGMIWMQLCEDFHCHPQGSEEGFKPPTGNRT